MIGLAVLLCLVCTVGCAACSLFGSEATLHYKDAEGGKAVSSYDGNTSNVSLVIPDTFEGEPVVEIGAFGVAACEYLTSITIGKNVRVISERAFCSLPNLTEFVVDAENAAFKSVDGVLFTKDGTELVAYPNKKAGDGSYVVPETVTKIRSCAFYCCSELTKLTLGSAVREVGDYACIKCSGMTELNLNEGLQRIGRDGFSFCESLTKLEIPASVEYIGDYGFYAKTSKVTTETFIVKKSLSEITLGKSWKPQASGLESSAVEPTIREEK